MESSAARLSCAIMEGFDKTTVQAVFVENQQIKEKKRLQETACHNIMTTIPVFQGQKAGADSTLLAHPSTCWMQIAHSSFANRF